MQLEGLTRLEGEINRVIRLIDLLLGEKEELEAQNRELWTRIQECEENIQRLEDENQKLWADRARDELLLARQYQIRDKVKSILAKFDQL